MIIKQNIFLLIIILSCLSSNYLLSWQKDYLNYLSRSKPEEQYNSMYITQKFELENIIKKLQSNSALMQLFILQINFSVLKNKLYPKSVKATKEAYKQYAKNYNNLMKNKISESLNIHFNKAFG